MWRHLFVLMFLYTPFVYGAELAGIVEKYDGKVLIHEDGSVRGKNIEAEKSTIHIGDSVRTKGNSHAYIRFTDGSRVVLTENSSITINEIDNANVDGGRILFEIRKRGEAKGLQITSATVTMGVKGTRFAVGNDEDRVTIFLKEGKLEIASLEGFFKRQRGGLKGNFDAMQGMMKRDFESSTNRMKAEFEEAQRQMQEGNIEYVSEFLMDAGSAVSISEGEVTDLEVPADLDGDFDLLDNF